VAHTTWRNGPVSSSRTGSVPKSARYHGTLRFRSLTVSATCVIVGNSDTLPPRFIRRQPLGGAAIMPAPRSGRQRLHRDRTPPAQCGMYEGAGSVNGLRSGFSWLWRVAKARRVDASLAVVALRFGW